MSNPPPPPELPEGSDPSTGRPGGGFVPGRPRPNPEIEPFAGFNLGSIQNVLVQELQQLRERLHGVESRLFVSRAGGFGAGQRAFNPAEFPEGGEGGGGGRPPFEIAEIVEIADIAEFTGAKSVLGEVTALRQQFTAFEGRITAQLDNITQLVTKLQSKQG